MLKIGVFLSQTLHSGGGFQYERTICNVINEYGHDYEFIFFTLHQDTQQDFKSLNIDVNYIKNTFTNRVKNKVCTLIPFANLITTPKMNVNETLSRFNIDLVYFVSPSNACTYLSDLNYIMTVWDLCHRDFMEFPEVRENNEFENRENFYSKSLKKSVAVISDSELGSKNIIKRYGVDSSRVTCIPFLPAEFVAKTEFIDIKAKFSVDGDYIFYPAQFWAHKNHVYILDALKMLKEQHNIKLCAIFTGSDKGNKQYIHDLAKKYGLDKQVKFLGFVEDELLPNLYRQALALVMPTYFGPTNIPPLEAFALGCPVCYSDLPGLREQIKDNGFLLDLTKPQCLVDSLLTIMNDKTLVQTKIEQGKKFITSHNKKEIWLQIDKILNSFLVKRKTWG